MLLSELEFGSFLSYSPRGQDDASRKSQLWVRRLKAEYSFGIPPIPMSEYVAVRIEERLAETELERIFSARSLLVPVPSSVLTQSTGLWVPYLLAKALVRHRLGHEVAPCLERTRAIRKAAAAAASERPTALEHFATMRAKHLAFPPDDIVLIDDVITRGATLLAAASRLREIFPKPAIRAFAVVRTFSNPQESREVFDPCIGMITLRDDQTYRRP